MRTPAAHKSTEALVRNAANEGFGINGSPDTDHQSHKAGPIKKDQK
jgi:hypothetical protein